MTVRTTRTCSIYVSHAVRFAMRDEKMYFVLILTCERVRTKFLDTMSLNWFMFYFYFIRRNSSFAENELKIRSRVHFNQNTILHFELYKWWRWQVEGMDHMAIRDSGLNEYISDARGSHHIIFFFHCDEIKMRITKKKLRRRKESTNK